MSPIKLYCHLGKGSLSSENDDFLWFSKGKLKLSWMFWEQDGCETQEQGVVLLKHHELKTEWSCIIVNIDMKHFSQNYTNSLSFIYNCLPDCSNQEFKTIYVFGLLRCALESWDHIHSWCIILLSGKVDEKYQVRNILHWLQTIFSTKNRKS